MRREYGAVLEQLRVRELEQAQARQGLRSARLERIVAVRGEAQQRSARVGRLRSLAQAVGAQAPEIAAAVAVDATAVPAGDDDAAWSGT